MPVKSVIFDLNGIFIQSPVPSVILNEVKDLLVFPLFRKEGVGEI